MAYTVHNFLKQTALKASQLNEMDAQIKKNADITEEYNKETIIEEIAKLTLTTDGQYVILKYGDEEISEIEIQDTSLIVPCTGLTVTSDSTLSVESGKTATISATRQPSDCTQNIRYKSDDILVASVNSSGVVTGVNIGKTNINIKCGSQSGTIQTNVWGYAKPTIVLGYWSSDTADTNTKVDESTYWFNYLDTDDTGIIFPQEEGTNLILKTGQKVTVETSTNLTIYGGANRAHAYAPLTDSGFIYATNWSDRNCIGNAEMVAIIEKTDEQHLTYTATKDCYINFEIAPNDGTTISDYLDTIYDTTQTHWMTIKIEEA